MSQKIYQLQRLEEVYEDAQKELTHQMDNLYEKKHDVLKTRETIFDKCQYLSNKGLLIQGYHHTLDCILMHYHDEVNKLMTSEIKLLEEYRDDNQKIFHKSYDLIMEENDE